VLNEERRRAILDLLTRQGRVLVTELSRHFDTSQVTIRKDLEILHAHGQVHRTHGGALPAREGTLEDPTLREKEKLHRQEKLRIAECAAAKVKEGFMDFDVVIATPDAMKVVGQLGQILGPRGLMPNPKVGTVSADVSTAVKNAKAGQVQYRTDKAGIIQCTIGRASFTPEQLKANLVALIEALNKSRPAGTKGIYVKKISVSSTMGTGVRVDSSTFMQQGQAH